ncbi:MAG: zf-TFIIB domain-containing protein [Gammaproteobacteria bacterium]|nr:zf-TFIIB domain-containing protein [Gammaproteobacteria bacterium]
MMFDRDKHCGQCGANVIAPALAVHRDGGTGLPCPRCNMGLTANLVENQLFDRCDRCGGIWAHHIAIEGLVTRSQQKRSVRTWLQALPAPAGGSQDRRVAAQCPDCEQFMEQYRIPTHKNIVIDACGMHGVWFDHREIRSIVGEAKRRVSGRRRHQYHRVRNRSQFATFLDDADDWWPWEALEELLDFLEDLFE